MLLPALEAVALIAVPQAAEPAPIFAPPIATALTYRIERVQRSGTREARFAAERRVRFARDDDGFAAEVTLVSVTTDAAGPGARFEAAMAAFRDVPVRFRLDRDGRITEVQELDSHWTRFVEAFGPPSADNPTASAAIASLTTLPDVQRQAMIASMLDAVLHSDIAGAGIVAERDTVIAPRPPYASATGATGRYRVDRRGDTLVATTTAAFAVAVPDGGTAQVGIAESAEVDAATGLLLRQRDVRTDSLPGGTVEVSTTTATLARGI